PSRPQATWPLDGLCRSTALPPDRAARRAVEGYAERLGESTGPERRRPTPSRSPTGAGGWQATRTPGHTARDATPAEPAARRHRRVRGGHRAAPARDAVPGRLTLRSTI